jgi:hypothetical protein
LVTTIWRTVFSWLCFLSVGRGPPKPRTTTSPPLRALRSETSPSAPRSEESRRVACRRSLRRRRFKAADVFLRPGSRSALPGHLVKEPGCRRSWCRPWPRRSSPRSAPPPMMP